MHPLLLQAVSEHLRAFFSGIPLERWLRQDKDERFVFSYGFQRRFLKEQYRGQKEKPGEAARETFAGNLGIGVEALRKRVNRTNKRVGRDRRERDKAFQKDRYRVVAITLAKASQWLVGEAGSQWMEDEASRLPLPAAEERMRLPDEQ